MEEGTWASLLPELLAEIVRRVEAGGERWPERKDLVACAGVCRRWREAVKAITLPPYENGWITFPSSLKEPGPREPPIQCFIRRNKKYSTFYLYLGLTQSLTDNGKFLLAARQIRHGTHTDYIISLDADDLTQESNAYMGKLRSNLLGTTFKIYDSKPPYSGASAKMSNGGAIRRATSKQVSPPVPRGDFEIGIVSYILNLRKRGPRRMHCLLQCASSRDTAEEESSKPKAGAPVPLRNKDPRWHERLQCWCLNFHGRVTMASVKNFQLVATAGGSQALAVGGETVLLQFGKVGDDVFTMDYRRPLSAFQAFAICLSSFGAKFACK